MPMLNYCLGGHNCHDLYFKNIAPPNKGGGQEPEDDSPLMQAIVKTWRSIESFIEDFCQ